MNERPNQDPATVEQGTIPQRSDTTNTQTNRDAAQTTATTAPASTDRGTVGGNETRTDSEDTGFLPADRMSSLRDRWSDVQAGFVDDPQSAVQQAHALVTELVDDLVQTFSRERTSLEQQWSGGGNADTEDLRLALQRYRSFFNRLLGT